VDLLLTPVSAQVNIKSDQIRSILIAFQGRPDDVTHKMVARKPEKSLYRISGIGACAFALGHT
jgi:hypothetical protein